MRVLLTTDTVGGVWTFTRELAIGLLQRGHAVALVSFGGLPNAERKAWAARLTGVGEFVYEASAVPLEWMHGNAEAMEGARVLEQVAHAFAPDLLHSSQFCFGALRGLGPCVVTAHSDVLSWAAVCKPGGLDETEWLRQYRELVQAGLDAAEAVAAPTTWMLGALAQNFTLPDTREVILNGRDVPARPPSAKSLQAVTVGRLWDEAKGLRLLEDLVLPFPLIIAGQTRGEVAEAQLTDAAQYVGVLNENELSALFEASAIYLVPSIYEPFGLAPLEAALCGCAVVANDLASLREVWGAGALYFTGAEDLQGLLLRLQQDAGLLARAQERSRARAQELTAGRMTEHYLRLYKAVLAQPKAAAKSGMVYAY